MLDCWCHLMSKNAKRFVKLSLAVSETNQKYKLATTNNQGILNLTASDTFLSATSEYLNKHHVMKLVHYVCS